MASGINKLILFGTPTPDLPITNYGNVEKNFAYTRDSLRRLWHSLSIVPRQPLLEVLSI